MAPELVSKKPYDCKVDVWAMGVIAYNLLIGEQPFKNRSNLTDNSTGLYEEIKTR